MTDSTASHGFDRSAAGNVWRRTLSQIPAIFGRLVYLSSLRDPNSARYQHYGLAQAFGETQADETLRRCHEDVFAEWLSFNLEQQKRDLEEYLCGLDSDIRTTVATWIRLAPYRNLVPTAVRDPERQLFLADLETILELLKHEHGVASPDPDA